MEDLFWIGFVGAAIALLFAWLQRSRVMSFSEGNEKMRKIAASIREGANAYLKHQYTTVFKVFLVVFILLLIIAFGSGGKMLSQFTPFAFLTGGTWSMLAGLHRREERRQQHSKCNGRRHPLERAGRAELDTGQHFRRQAGGECHHMGLRRPAQRDEHRWQRGGRWRRGGR